MSPCLATPVSRAQARLKRWAGAHCPAGLNPVRASPGPQSAGSKLGAPRAAPLSVESPAVLLGFKSQSWHLLSTVPGESWVTQGLICKVGVIIVSVSKDLNEIIHARVLRTMSSIYLCCKSVYHHYCYCHQAFVLGACVFSMFIRICLPFSGNPYNSFLFYRTVTDLFFVENAFSVILQGLRGGGHMPLACHLETVMCFLQVLFL